jgi:hypothetical protein
MSNPAAHRRVAPAFSLPGISGQALGLAATAAALLYIAFTLPRYPLLAQFRPEALGSLPDVVAPLIVIALFIERAVEIVTTAWRAGGARRLEGELDVAMASSTLEQQWDARHRLDLYLTRTQRYAFLVAFIIALLISMMGVRAIEMLVSEGVVRGAPLAQQALFVRVDVVLTALLLAGGADGIHKVVLAFTSFMETTKERLDDRDLARRPGVPAANPPAAPSADPETLAVAVAVTAQSSD